MSLSDYTDLRVAVGEFVNNRNLSDVMKRITLNAETTLNRKVRHRKMLTPATLTFVTGVCPLPVDYMEFEQVKTASGQLLDETNLDGAISPGLWYATDATSIKCPYVGDGTLSVVYYAKLPTLTAGATTTNWLLQDSPNAYLYACAFHAGVFLRDQDIAAKADDLLKTELMDIAIDSERARFGNARIKLPQNGT